MEKTDGTLVIGIQGGPGSFNEEACRSYCMEAGIEGYRIEYLYTTRKVLKALHEGGIDRGIFAVENSIGGTVMETINALSEYNCKILASHGINVRHCLHARAGTKAKDIDTIMSHPQALAQCRKTLAKRFPRARLISGEGDFVDSATAAKALAEGKMPDTTAVVAPKICSELFGLELLAENLQDKKKNITTFLFVSRFDGHSEAKG